MIYATGTRAVQAAGQALHAGSRQRVPCCRRFGIRFAGTIALLPALRAIPFCGRHVRRTTQVQAVGLPPARREGEKGSHRHA